MSLDLFGRSGVGEARDGLDRHFTPDALARVICQRIARIIDEPRIILEPSVGGGAFVRAARRTWPRAMIIGCDVDPMAEGRHIVDEFIEGDFPAIDWTSDAFDLVLGNPPFSGATAIRHVEAAKAVGDAVCFVLPWSPLGGVSRWAEHMSGTGAPSYAFPIAPRPWPKSIRETAAMLWRHGENQDGTLVQWLERWK